MSHPMKVEGDVHRIRCRSCAAFGCACTFAGDTDTVTEGLMDFTEGRDDEIYIAKLTGAVIVKGKFDHRSAEAAANRLFNRSSFDLRGSSNGLDQITQLPVRFANSGRPTSHLIVGSQ